MDMADYEGSDFVDGGGYDVAELTDEADPGLKIDDICAYTIVGRMREIHALQQLPMEIPSPGPSPTLNTRRISPPKQRPSLIDGVTMFWPDEIKIHKRLGKGNFGLVFEVEVDIANDRKKWTTAAMKCMKIKKGQLAEILKEAKVLVEMSKSHRHVLKFIGLTSQIGENAKFIDGHVVPELNGKLGMLNEFCERGSLDQLHDATDIDFLSPSTFNRTVSGILSGLLHIHLFKLVHRDIACRNLLMRADGSVVIGDYGLTKKVDKEDSQYVAHSGTIMSKSSAPESYSKNIFTFSSDVWMVGVTVWELLNKGKSLPTDVREDFKRGRHPYQIDFDLVVPPYAQPLMDMCLKLNPKHRRSPFELLQWMSKRSLIPPDVKETIPSAGEASLQYWRAAIESVEYDDLEPIREPHGLSRKGSIIIQDVSTLPSSNNANRETKVSNEGSVIGQTKRAEVDRSSTYSVDSKYKSYGYTPKLSHLENKSQLPEENQKKDEEEEEEYPEEVQDKKFPSISDIKIGIKVKIISSVAKAAKLVNFAQLGFNSGMVHCCGKIETVEQKDYPSKVKAGRWWWPLSCIEKVTRADFTELQKKRNENKTLMKLEVGKLIDFLNRGDDWMQARIVAIEKTRVKVNILGYPPIHDEWIDLASDHIQPLGTKSLGEFVDEQSLSKDQLRMRRAAIQIFHGQTGMSQQREASRKSSDDPVWPPSGIDLSSIRDGTPVQHFLMSAEVSLRRIGILARRKLAQRVKFPRFCPGGFEAERQNVIEGFLPQAEMLGIYIIRPILDLWNGERDDTKLCDGLPEDTAALMRCIWRTTVIHEEKQLKLEEVRVRRVKIETTKSLTGVYKSSGNNSSGRPLYTMEGAAAKPGEKIPTLSWDVEKEDWGLTDSDGISVARIRAKSMLPPSGVWRSGAKVTYLKDDSVKEGKEGKHPKGTTFLEQIVERYSYQYNMFTIKSAINRLKKMDFTEPEIADAANRFAFEYDDMLNFLIGFEAKSRAAMRTKKMFESMSDEHKRLLYQQVMADISLSDKDKQVKLAEMGFDTDFSGKSGKSPDKPERATESSKLREVLVDKIINDQSISPEKKSFAISRILSSDDFGLVGVLRQLSEEGIVLK